MHRITTIIIAFNDDVDVNHRGVMLLTRLDVTTDEQTINLRAYPSGSGAIGQFALTFRFPRFPHQQFMLIYIERNVIDVFLKYLFRNICGCTCQCYIHINEKKIVTS